MLRLPTSLLTCALVLGAATAVHAQDVSCPASSTRLKLTPINGAAAPNFLDGARYVVHLGRTNNGSGTQVLAALVIRNGVCQPPMWVKDAAGQTTQLTVDSNFCVGGGDDIVFVTRSSPTTISMCGLSVSLNAFAYGGRRLGIYSGNGGDIVYGGNGTDFICGGGGGDILRGNGGSEDELYGESGLDVLQDTTGSLSWSDGGSSDDVIIDGQGSGDGLAGSGGNDYLDSQCSSSLMFCGSGLGDQAASPDLPPPYALSLCEDWDTDLSC